MELFQKAKHIELIISDVDGVLTDGTIYFAEQGKTWKGFNSLDGQGIALFLKQGLQFAIISDRHESHPSCSFAHLCFDHIGQK